MSSDSAAERSAADQSVALVNRGAVTRWFLLLVPVALVVLVCLPAVANLIANAWSAGRDRSYSQGWLVAPICLWLLYRTAADLPAIRLRVGVPMTAAAFAMGVLALLAARTNVALFELVLLPLLMLVAIGALYGWQVARRCLFAIGFFYFAIPVWDVLNGALQWGTVISNRALIRVFGIPASFDATSIHLPSGTITIEGGCSGLHFFVVGLTLGTLHAYLSGKSLWRTVSLAALMSIAANWLRVFIILVAAHLTNMQHYLVRVDHYKFGWVVFAVMLVFFFWITARFRSHAAPLEGAPVESVAKERTNRLAVALAVAAIVAGPVTSLALDLRSPASQFHEVAGPAGWTRAEAPPAPSWEPRFESADRITRRTWRNGSSEVDSFQAEFTFETFDKKLAGFGNTVLGADVYSETEGPADLNGWREAVVTNGPASRVIVWYTYYVGARRYPSALRAQMQYGVSSLVHPVMSGVVAFRAACAADCAPERALIREFASAAATP